MKTTPGKVSWPCFMCRQVFEWSHLLKVGEYMICLTCFGDDPVILTEATNVKYNIDNGRPACPNCDSMFSKEEEYRNGFSRRKCLKCGRRRMIQLEEQLSFW